MRVLHTADWHIGRALYGKKRDFEYEAFLNWLETRVQELSIDVLLIAGDIFDTGTPSNRSQEIYYNFLSRMAASNCRHVVVIGGNHDSPSFLNAPKKFLSALDIHVVGSAQENLEDEVLVLKDLQGNSEAIICAVPYLRDRDVRVAMAGESIQDKEHKLLEGIRNHYAEVVAIAEAKRQSLGAHLPIIAMGHLFAAGGQTVDGDGVRDLYVGSLAHVNAQIFPSNVNYVALGHLHVPQIVGGLATVRYSGSALPLGFGEAKQQKSLCLVEFTGTQASIQLVNIPTFQKLEQIKGDWDHILKRLVELCTAESRAWLEVIYEGNEVMGDLRERLEKRIVNTQLEILSIKSRRSIQSNLISACGDEELDHMSVEQVFERCLTENNIPEGQRLTLMHAYGQIVTSLYTDDQRAE